MLLGLGLFDFTAFGRRNPVFQRLEAGGVIVRVVRIGHDKACSLVDWGIRCGPDRVKLRNGVAKMLFLLSCTGQDEGERGVLGRQSGLAIFNQMVDVSRTSRLMTP
jgi:hypothetical protein